MVIFDKKIVADAPFCQLCRYVKLEIKTVFFQKWPKFSNWRRDYLSLNSQNEIHNNILKKLNQI